jgi:hypothetical protein
MRGEKDEVEERGAVAEELTAEARRSRKNFYHRGHRGTQRKIGKHLSTQRKIETLQIGKTATILWELMAKGQKLRARS